MGGINARVFASTYMTALPDEATLRREVVATKQALEGRAAGTSCPTPSATTWTC
jgi:hypothetical protein